MISCEAPAACFCRALQEHSATTVQTQRKISKTQRRISKTQRRISKTQRDISKTQQHLSKTQRDISKTQQHRVANTTQHFTNTPEHLANTSLPIPEIHDQARLPGDPNAKATELDVEGRCCPGTIPDPTEPLAPGNAALITVGVSHEARDLLLDTAVHLHPAQ